VVKTIYYDVQRKSDRAVIEEAKKGTILCKGPKQ